MGSCCSSNLTNHHDETLVWKGEASRRRVPSSSLSNMDAYEELRDVSQQDQETMITMTNEKGSIQQQYRQLNSEKDLIAERDRLIAAKEELAASVRQQQNTVAFPTEEKDKEEQLRRQLEEEKEELSAECQRQREMVETLKAESTQKEELEAMEEQNEKLRAEIESMRSGSDKMREQMTAMDIMQSKKDEMEQRYESIVADKEKLENELQTVKNVAQQIAAMKQKNKRLQQDLETSRLKQEHTMERYNSVVSERDKLTKEFETYKEWRRTREQIQTTFNLSQRTSKLGSNRTDQKDDEMEHLHSGKYKMAAQQERIGTLEEEVLKLRYQIGDWLGKGTFGVVFESEDKLTNEKVAVKIVKLTQIMNRDPHEILRTLRTEQKVMKRCHHKNIVKLLEYYEKGREEAWFVMELCAGGNLREFLHENGPLNEPVARTFAVQITEALLHLKSMEMSHRDLKPANILLTAKSKDAVIKLADFGTAAFKMYNENGDTVYQTLAGTGCYMAPEVLAKEQDIYGSNGILHLCFFCHLPSYCYSPFLFAVFHTVFSGLVVPRSNTV